MFWFQAIEKFSANTCTVGHTLRALCQRFAETEFPNDVSATELLIADHEDEQNQVKDELDSTVKHGEVSLLGSRSCGRRQGG